MVSLPVRAGYLERRDDDERVSRRRKIAGAVEMKALPAPNSATEALDRLTIPADAMAQITEALSTGGSPPPDVPGVVRWRRFVARLLCSS